MDKINAILKNKKTVRILKIFFFIVILYTFLLSIGLMSSSFKFFGKGFAQQLLVTTSNPIVGLFIGIFITSIVQSSSVTTSLVVAFVAGGIIPLENAVPIILGSNIGTTVTNTIVSFTQITKTEEFRRAFSAAIIHDSFNVLNVLIILPLELLTGFLHKSAKIFADLCWGSQSITYSSPLKIILKPVQKPIIHFFQNIVDNQLLSGILLFIFSILFLFLALTLMVKIMKSLLLNRTEVVFNNIIQKAGIIGIIIGTLFTMLIQSSSITTSILVPLAGAGIITLHTVLPIVLGANIGTTITALLAALASNKLGLTIAFVHLFFNLFGTLLFYPIPFMRNIPIKWAQLMGNFMAKHKRVSILYVIFAFYILPWLLILIF